MDINLTSLTDNEIANLRILLSLPHVRWLEISSRLKNFYKRGSTSIASIAKNMRFSPTIMDAYEFYAVGSKSTQQFQPIEIDVFNMFLNLAVYIANLNEYVRLTTQMNEIPVKAITDTHDRGISNAAVGEQPPNLTSSSMPRHIPTSAAKKTAAAAASAPFESKFIIVKNLPSDVAEDELVVLINNKLPKLSYLTVKSIDLDKVDGSVTAYMTLGCVIDAKEVLYLLNNQIFGKMLLSVEFGYGKPCKVIWLGGMNSSTALTENDVRSYFSKYGTLTRVDFIRSRASDTAYSFIEFKYLADAVEALSSNSVYSNCKSILINDTNVVIRYGTESHVGKEDTRSTDIREPRGKAGGGGGVDRSRERERSRSRSRSRDRYNASGSSNIRNGGSYGNNSKSSSYSNISNTLHSSRDRDRDYGAYNNRRDDEPRGGYGQTNQSSSAAAPSLHQQPYRSRSPPVRRPAYEDSNNRPSYSSNSYPSKGNDNRSSNNYQRQNDRVIRR